MTTWSSLSQRFRKTRPPLGWDAKAINTQNDLFQIHIKIHIFEVSLGLISFESLDSLQLDVLNCLEEVCSFEYLGIF